MKRSIKNFSCRLLPKVILKALLSVNASQHNKMNRLRQAVTGSKGYHI